MSEVQMKGYLYILQSLKNSRYYIGSSTNWKRRLEEHNQGKSPYTKLTRPWKIKYLKEFDTIAEARKEEMNIKRMKNRNVLEELIASYSSRSSVG